MADSAVFETALSGPLAVESYAGPYTVVFDDGGLASLNADVPEDAHFIVDARVAEFYANELASVLQAPSVLVLEAVEPTKSLERFPAYVEHLVAREVRRGHALVAIGGGVIQDIACFLAAILLRGLEWRFYPTTLLAQADSCIGSKSSINVGEIKNVLGTFTPPSQVVVCPHVLDTLSQEDMRSGIGEMLKVHAIEEPESFDRMAADYPTLTEDRELLARYIRRSLQIKRAIIEEDEFDRGPRNVMNYGHSFGHAIESATGFAVPHGIAVTIGMDMANYVAARLGRSTQGHYERMHPTLAANYAGFDEVEIPLDALFAGLTKDKKNLGTALRLVLPDASGRVSLTEQPLNEGFRSICVEYLAEELVRNPAHR